MIGVDLSRKVIPDDHLNLETCEFKRYEYYIYTPLTKKGNSNVFFLWKIYHYFLWHQISLFSTSGGYSFKCWLFYT